MSRFLLRSVLVLVLVGASAEGARAQDSAPPRERAYTGVSFRTSVTPTAEGAITHSHPVVHAVRPGSPGEKSGLVPGDVILEMDGRDAREDGAMRMYAGGRYTLRIRRGEEEHEIVILPVAAGGAEPDA